MGELSALNTWLGMYFAIGPAETSTQLLLASVLLL